MIRSDEVSSQVSVNLSSQMLFFSVSNFYQYFYILLRSVEIKAIIIPKKKNNTFFFFELKVKPTPTQNMGFYEQLSRALTSTQNLYKFSKNLTSIDPFKIQIPHKL